MSDNPVLYQVQGAVATITLNRPDVLNALNDALTIALGAAVNQAASDEAIRAVMITANGRGFSAGADLSAVPAKADKPRDSSSVLRERYNPMISTIRAMPKPVITVVNGVAAGAGMSIALSGDIVLAGASASFLQAFAKIGLVPDAGSTYFLPRYVGQVRARALAMLADRIDAATALSYGMVWKVFPDDQLRAEADKLAVHMANMPTRAYAAIKQALNGSLDRTLEEQLELEANLQTELGRTEDFREGVSAFLQKRAPNFKGR
jgi:2-(1,2-epoxy-1,2-dihydrophenyl)acetyl-CoA isomerase